MHIMWTLEMLVLLAAAACVLSWVFGELHGAARARAQAMAAFDLPEGSAPANNALMSRGDFGIEDFWAHTQFDRHLVAARSPMVRADTPVSLVPHDADDPEREHGLATDRNPTANTISCESANGDARRLLPNADATISSATGDASLSHIHAMLRRQTFEEMPPLEDLRSQTALIRLREPLWAAPDHPFAALDQFAAASSDILRHYRDCIEDMSAACEPRKPRNGKGLLQEHALLASSA